MRLYTQKNAPDVIRRGLRHVTGLRVVSITSPDLNPLEQVFVTVQDAGTPSRSQATSRENVHVTVYGPSEPEVREVLEQVDALLLSRAIRWGFHLEPGGGLLVTKDDETGGFVGSTTVVAASPKNEKDF